MADEASFLDIKKSVGRSLHFNASIQHFIVSPNTQYRHHASQQHQELLRLSDEFAQRAKCLREKHHRRHLGGKQRILQRRYHLCGNDEDHSHHKTSHLPPTLHTSMGRCWQMLHHSIGETIVSYLLLMVGKKAWSNCSSASFRAICSLALPIGFP